MSGLEAIGIAASIIQVADLGTKLSVKLFSFYRQVKNADQAIQSLSSDVALTCALLRELGDTLRTDDQSKLYSKEAFQGLRDVIRQCQGVLQKIDNTLSYTHGTGKTRLQQITGRFRLLLLEPTLDPLKNDLENLKSTMVLLLNVIIYAGQVRSNNIPAVLREQRDLIESLLDERRGNDQERYPSKANACTKSNKISGSAEWTAYNGLIRKMLQEIDFCKCTLENSRHYRIKDGILNIHSGEIMRFHVSGDIPIRFDQTLFAEHSRKTNQIANSPVTISHSVPISPPKSRLSGIEKADDIYDSDDAIKRPPPLQTMKSNPDETPTSTHHDDSVRILYRDPACPEAACYEREHPQPTGSPTRLDRSSIKKKPPISTTTIVCSSNEAKKDMMSTVGTQSMQEMKKPPGPRVGSPMLMDDLKQERENALLGDVSKPAYGEGTTNPPRVYVSSDSEDDSLDSDGNDKGGYYLEGTTEGWRKPQSHEARHHAAQLRRRYSRYQAYVESSSEDDRPRQSRRINRSATSSSDDNDNAPLARPPPPLPSADSKINLYSNQFESLLLRWTTLQKREIYRPSVSTLSR